MQGPDEVHIMQNGILELRRATELHARYAKQLEAEEALFKRAGIKQSHL